MAGASSWSSMVQGNVDAPCPYSQTLEIYGSESCKEWLCGGVTVLYKPGISGTVSINYFSPMDVHSIVHL